jgi:hypothetical protein
MLELEINNENISLIKNELEIKLSNIFLQDNNIKKDYFYNSNNIDNSLLTINLNLTINDLNQYQFEKSLNIYFYLYEPFIKIFNYLYNRKVNINNFNTIKNILDISELLRNNNINLIDSSYFSKNNGENILTNLANKNNCRPEDINNALSMINYIKNYNGINKYYIGIKNNYFYNIKPKTNIDNLINDIKSIQQKSGNKKLVYTNNINSYDTFWDIEDELVESDTDYIYISNVYDKNVCKNFNYIYCNLDSSDSFYLNRYIKFNKQLFNCYDKILYIDSNVKINQKLNKFFNLLDDSCDLVLFKHPERNILKEELNVLVACKNMYHKWELNIKNIDNLIINYKNEMDNNLFWLNVQLSNTKYNIYDEIHKLYLIYKLKRDQIFFSIIQNKYKIKIINIKATFDRNIDEDIKYFDGDYGYIDFWSNYFSRPFGGKHI